MNLLYLFASPLPSRDAESVNAMKMCQAFAKAGHQVTMLKPRRPGRTGEPPGFVASAHSEVPTKVEDVFGFYGVEPNFTIHTLPWARTSGKTYRYAVRAALVAHRRRPDLVVSRSVEGALACSWLGLPVILDRHDHITTHGPALTKVFRWLLRRPLLLRITVNCQALKQALLDAFPISEGRIVVAHNGSDPYPPLRPVPPEVERTLDTNPKGLKVGYIGSLFPGKGMEMVAGLALAAPWAHFHVVGGDSSEISSWEERGGGLGNLHFHGHQPHPVADAIRRRMDVLLIPNRREVYTHSGSIDIGRWTSPIKVFESMASHVAILASDLPILREVLSPDNALLAKPDDVEAWVSGLEALRDPALRRRLAEQARRDFEANYTWDRRADRLLEGLLPDPANPASRTTVPRRTS